MKGFKEKERGKTSSVIIILLSFIICQRCCGLEELDLDAQQRRHHGMKTKLAHERVTFCLSDQHMDRSLSVSVTTLCKHCFGGLRVYSGYQTESITIIGFQFAGGAEICAD